MTPPERQLLYDVHYNKQPLLLLNQFTLIFCPTFGNVIYPH